MTTHDIGRHLHCYGQESVISPNLDAFAADGVRFTLAFATAPQCSPSRASLASGMYPHNNGVMGLTHAGFDWALAVPHAAAILGERGFQAHLFGGQHVTSHPEGLGFEAIHPIADFEKVVAQKGKDQRLYLEINFDETHRPYPPAGETPRGSPSLGGRGSRSSPRRRFTATTTRCEASARTATNTSATSRRRSPSRCPPTSRPARSSAPTPAGTRGTGQASPSYTTSKPTRLR